MTNREAIDVLSDFSKQIIVKPDGAYERDIFVEAKRIAIESLRKQTHETISESEIGVDQWIPVKDKLPDDYVDVLTCDKKGNMHIFSHCKGYEYPFCIPPDHTRYYMPVAWLPLPQPCKGE